MGYQESFICVHNLAEASGICSALLNTSEEHPDFQLYGVDRVKRTLYMWDPFDTCIPPREDCWQIRPGTLLVVVGGARSPWQTVQDMIYVDAAFELARENCREFLEGIPEDELAAAAVEHPGVASEFRRVMERYLAGIHRSPGLRPRDLGLEDARRRVQEGASAALAF